MSTKKKGDNKMNKRNRRMLVNWIMMISLVLVMGSGFLLKFIPGMWMGIIHAVSGLILFICAMIHCLQHGMLKGKKKVGKR